MTTLKESRKGVADVENTEEAEKQKHGRKRFIGDGQHALVVPQLAWTF